MLSDLSDAKECSFENEKLETLGTVGKVEIEIEDVEDEVEIELDSFHPSDSRWVFHSHDVIG